jgi:large subunit ribosomal protein L24
VAKKISPKSPRKQRRFVRNSGKHAHKSMLRCRLDDPLREEYGLRSLNLKKGDLVRIMRGQFRDTEGKILGVDYGAIRVFVDGASTTKADGKEAKVPLHPSNLLLVKLELNDERKKRIQARAAKIAESE